MELTDEQWALIEALFPVKPRRADGKGRPSVSLRQALNGVLWVLQTGARWKDLPFRYPPYQTCHRWFQTWVEQVVFKKILEALAKDLLQRGGIDVREAFIDGTFASAMKGGRDVGKTKRGKGTMIMAVTDRHGLPVAISTASASPHEVKLVEKYGTELIAPNRARRKRTQDARKLPRYRRRWKVGRLFAWLQNFRRLVVRYEYHAENFLAFVQLGCAVILLRRF